MGTVTLIKLRNRLESKGSILTLTYAYVLTYKQIHNYPFKCRHILGKKLQEKLNCELEMSKYEGVWSTDSTGRETTTLSLSCLKFPCLQYDSLM